MLTWKPWRVAIPRGPYSSPNRPPRLSGQARLQSSWPAILTRESNLSSIFLASIFQEARATAEQKDHLDWIIEAWARELPGLDTSPMAVVGRVLRASRFLERGIEAQLATFGLNMTEFNILGALRRTGPPYRMAPADLSRSLLLSSGGLTKRIDRLEREGLIERSPALDDRRSVLVGLTPAGLALIGEAVGDHLANEERLIATLSPEQREAATDVLRTLLASFEVGSQPRRRRPQPTMRGL